MLLFSGASRKYFAIDLGTNNTLVYQPRRGIIFDEPTSLLFDHKGHKFFGSGFLSQKMVGKNPKNIEVFNPLDKGAISNIIAAKAYVKNLIQQLTKGTMLKPHIIVSVPSDLNSIERNAVIEAGKEGGAKSVLLLKDPFAAAIGSMQDISYPKGILVLDIGAGVSEISLLSCNGIVMSKSLRVAGNDLDEAIVEYFKNEKRIFFSLHEAEILKKEFKDILALDERIVKVSGKNLITRMPEIFDISSLDIRTAMLPVVNKIVTLVHSMLSTLPPSFALDIYDNGILLTGGTSMLGGLDAYISQKLEITIKSVENPLHNIILGAGKVIEDTRYNTLLSR